MATTHKQSPQQVARAVLADSKIRTDGEGLLGEVESLIMLGIELYSSADNQRPENLSEVCRRLGINLHWVDRRNLQYIDELSTNARFEIYVGHTSPFVVTTDERVVHSELEGLERAIHTNIPIWVKAAG